MIHRLIEVECDAEGCSKSRCFGVDGTEESPTLDGEWRYSADKQKQYCPDHAHRAPEYDSFGREVRS